MFSCALWNASSSVSSTFNISFTFKVQLKDAILLMIQTFPQPSKMGSWISLSPCHLLAYCGFHHANFWGFLSTPSPISILNVDSVFLLLRVCPVVFSFIPLHLFITMHTPDLVISNKSFTVQVSISGTISEHCDLRSQLPWSSSNTGSFSHHDQLGTDGTAFLCSFSALCYYFPSP